MGTDRARFAVFAAVALFTAVLWLFGSPLGATTYYVSGSGDDLADGTSPATAWATLQRVHAAQLVGGDLVLLEAGTEFVGPLTLAPPTCPEQPVTPIEIGSTGGGRAVIEAGDGPGIEVLGCGGILIRDLEIRGSGRATNTSSGLSFYHELPGDVQLGPVEAHGLLVHGFRKAGISVGAWNGRSGFRDVTIEDNEVHHNGDAGITVWGFFSQDPGHPHHDVRVARNRVHHNFGEPGKTDSHTGNGIVVGNADGVVIEYNVAHHNGLDNAATNGGPVGIWAWDSNDVLIQFNESWANGTASNVDGGGFDLDGGVTHGVMQYNYSHDNDGAGFLIAQFVGARPMHDLTVRFNISENDGRKNGYGGIHLWAGEGTPSGIDIVNNTVFMSPAVSGAPAAVAVVSSGFDSVRFVNNLLLGSGSVDLTRTVSGLPGVQFLGNGYWNPDGFRVLDGAVSFTDLASWRIASGQERLEGLDVGGTVDPLALGVGSAGTVGEAARLPSSTSYRLTIASPARSGGVDLAALALDAGPRDFGGVPLDEDPGDGVGAREFTQRLFMDGFESGGVLAWGPGS